MGSCQDAEMEGGAGWRARVEDGDHAFLCFLHLEPW